MEHNVIEKDVVLKFIDKYTNLVSDARARVGVAQVSEDLVIPVIISDLSASCFNFTKTLHEDIRECYVYNSIMNDEDYDLENPLISTLFCNIALLVTEELNTLYGELLERRFDNDESIRIFFSECISSELSLDKDRKMLSTLMKNLHNRGYIATKCGSVIVAKRESPYSLVILPDKPKVSEKFYTSLCGLL